MNEYGFIAWVVFLVVWVVLMRYILPRLGIPTCMSGMCGLPGDFYRKQAEDAKKTEGGGPDSGTAGK